MNNNNNHHDDIVNNFYFLSLFLAMRGDWIEKNH